ncbi:MAG: adenylate/guanylate cyclase domain-containing protein [Leptospiraceae bacterium]|nr:adenylate/guanylate cyclase domain-containing protein [Leptospiraceae bacterium]
MERKDQKYTNKEIRYELAKEIARYFLLHLRAELKKPSKVSEYITMEGISFKESTQKLIDKIYSLFPDIKENRPMFNFVKEWWDGSEFKNMDGRISEPYDNSTFKTQNQIFFFKIVDILEENPNHRKAFEENMLKTVTEFRKRGRAVEFELILSSEIRILPIFEIIVRRSHLPFWKSRNILYKQSEFMQRTAYKVFDKELKSAYNRTDEILKSILPEKIADELKYKGKVQPKLLPEISILFCDLVNFTNTSEKLSPTELLEELDNTYSHFDKIIKMHRMEKIKTIGDSYMATAGMNQDHKHHAVEAILSAIKIIEFIRKYSKSLDRKDRPSWKVRIGINSGQVVSGILGMKRFNYDIWGDSVNTAQRMEANGEQDRINVSRNTYELSKDFFEFESRGKIFVKGKGEMEMFFVKGIHPQLSLNGAGKTPNHKFKNKFIE